MSACFTCVLYLILQKTRVVIGGLFRLQGKVLLECEIGLQSYCYRAATVKCFGLLRDCTNEQSCQSFPSFLTSVSTGNIIILATVKLF